MEVDADEHVASRVQTRELLEPFDRDDRAGGVVDRLDQPGVMHLPRVVEAVEVDVDQRWIAGVRLAQHERRARHDPPIAAETFGHPLHEDGLAGAEWSDETDDRARTERPREIAADRARRLRTAGQVHYGRAGSGRASWHRER